MILTGEQTAELKEAIVKAYREQELEILLSEKMALSYEAIARGDNYTLKVAFLIQDMEAKGTVAQFIRIIVEEKPDNTFLQKFNVGRDTKICPYKGLYAFTKEDARFFRGRDKLTQTLMQAVHNQPFLAVIGNSGMGKSSVVFAGLIPELEKSGNWNFITFRPQDDPFAQMREGLLSGLEPTVNEYRRIRKRQEIKTNFENGKLTLKQFLCEEVKKNENRKKFMIVVDQFEELYTLSPEDKRKKFIDQLLEVINNQRDKDRPDVVIVITLRVDFYGFALGYQPLAEMLAKWKPETLIGMNRKELRSTIEEPAKLAEIKIEDELTDIILDEIIETPGELPLLQFALQELFYRRSDNQLTIATYDEIGRVEGSLVKYAESIYKELNEDEQKKVEHIFTQLVRFGERTENTRRLATYSQIGAENWDLVTDLANDRLVVTGYNEDQKQQTVEVVHEVLIRGWKRLQGWMVEAENFRKWQERLRFQMKTWEETDRNNSALLVGALLADAEKWLSKKYECITDQKEIEFINASRYYQEQEDIANIENLLELSQKELQLKQQLQSLFYAVKAAIKLRNIREPTKKLKKNVIERLEQGSHDISEKNKLIDHTSQVNGVAFSLNGFKIASVSDDNTVKLWDSKGQLLKTFKKHTDQVWGVSFSPDNQMIASASADRTVRIWTLDGKCVQVLEGHTDRVYGVSFSPDGQMIASGSVDKTVRIWKLDGTLWTLWKTLKGHNDRVYGVSFSPDGQMVASASADRTIKIWTLDGEVNQVLQGHTDLVYAVKFSPDGQTIASASNDKTVRLWTLDGRELNTLQHQDLVHGLNFSFDGKILLSASHDKTVNLWTLDGMKLDQIQHTEQVYTASFSPDGQIIAFAGADRTVNLYSYTAKSVFSILVGHTDRIWGVKFSPDGKFIASASDDKIARLWHIDPENLLLNLDVKLNYLLKIGCHWIRDYLKTNPNVHENDRNLCDEICS